MEHTSNPEWLKVGAFVRFMGWCGEITEIAHSDDKTYVRIFGAKSIYHGNKDGDFVPFDAKAITPVTTIEAIENYAAYVKQEKARLEPLTDLLNDMTYFIADAAPIK